MTLIIGAIEFVLTSVPFSDRCVIVIRDGEHEICVDATKRQAATLADAIRALANQ